MAKYDGVELAEEEKVLEDLEKALNKEMTKVEEIGRKTFGYMVEGGHIVGIGLAAKGVSNLPETIVNLTKLKILNLNDNYRLETLPEKIGKLTSLKVLDLSKNRLIELPESIGELVNLEELSLEGNRLEKLPESVSELVNLRKLNLKNNYRLETLPKNIEKLVNLEEAEISSYKLKDQLKRIGKMAEPKEKQIEYSLEFIKEKYQGVEITAEEVRALEELEKMLGEIIPAVDKLEWDTFGFLVENGKVVEIGLIERGIRKLPENFSNLVNLKLLDLNSNKLEELPEDIGKLIQLKELYVMRNQLTKIPESFTELTQLKKLDILHNKLKTLPENFGNLVSLETLDLFNNQLERIPESIGTLANLKELDIRENPLKAHPDSVKKLKEQGCNISWPLREQ